MELEAGRELDVLIAEKVMGLTVERAPQLDGVEFLTHRMRIPQYSTDIVAAWDVLERMYDLTDTSWYMRRDARGWFVETFDGDRDSWAFTEVGFGETAPLAICRAALAAISQPVPLQL